MDLNLLLLFAEIVETPNLSEAARRLGLSRSRVSQQLKLLERQIGAQLMRRTTRRVDLTDAGRTAYEHAIRLREDANAARAASRAMRATRAAMSGSACRRDSAGCCWPRRCSIFSPATRRLR